jgi:putative transposase
MATKSSINNEIVNEMLAGQDPKTIIESNGLLDDPEKALNERMLNAEVDQHLGRESA